MSYTHNPVGINYSERLRALKLIGFSNYQQYLDSSLWDLIRRSTLYRDRCECLGLRCPLSSRIIQVHHLSYSLSTLLGINPSCLISLCTDCHTYCECDGGIKITDPYIVRSRTLFCVANLNYRQKGKGSKGSSKRIGEFFKARWVMNQSHARKVFQRMQRDEPKWAILIVKWLCLGKLPSTFIEYLGLENLVDQIQTKSKRLPRSIAKRTME